MGRSTDLSNHLFGNSTMTRITLTVALLLAVVSAGCSPSPRLSLNARQEDGSTTFEFSTRGINGLLGLRVWKADTKELLWDVNLSYYRGPRLRYGDLPRDFETFNGQKDSATQAFPAKREKPRPLPANSKLYVSVDCQYDSFMAASSQTFLFSITTDTNGRVLAASRVDSLSPDDFPKKQ